MIPMQTRVIVTHERYRGTEGVIVGKCARVDLYNVRTERLIFWGTPINRPHGAEINLWPSEFTITA
jgi:hypothetical protein